MTTLIIRSTNSQLADGTLKSNFGDLLRSTILLQAVPSNFFWITNETGKKLLHSFIDKNKLLNYEEALQQLDFSKNVDIYNLDNYVPHEQLFMQLQGTWHGYLYKEKKVHAENETFDAITPYTPTTYKHSWQQALIEGLGLTWEEQDYAQSMFAATNNYDVGFNWHTHPDWTAKQWPKKHWEELQTLLETQGLSVSWQEGLNDFDEYIQWINSCKIIVSIESLGLHLASALRKQIVALVGPVKNTEYPYHRLFKIEPTARECMPCNAPACTMESHCLSELLPQVVATLVTQTAQK